MKPRQPRGHRDGAERRGFGSHEEKPERRWQYPNVGVEWQAVS